MKNCLEGIVSMARLCLSGTFATYVAISAMAVPAKAATLEKIISREDPKFNCANSVMTVGRDGNVYLGSNVQGGAYVLRVSPDGTKRLGGDVIYALTNATANADGLIATANAHFSHSVNIYDKEFKHLVVCNEFLVNDQVGWDAPSRVEVGASGDFYGIDQHRLRILRINKDGRIVQAYAFPADAKSWDFRVCEANKSFYLLSRDNTMRRMSFEGKIIWTQKIGPAFTVADDGAVLYLAGNTLKKLSADGQPLPDLALSIPADKFPVTAIALCPSGLVAKRAHPSELFQLYDLAAGTLKSAASSVHEKVSVEFPALTWTSGQAISFSIKTSGVPLRWRVWATSLGVSDWRELELKDGKLSVPADFAGLYQIRVAPTLNPTAQSEYTLREIVEVRIPDSKGTVSVWTPLNRICWARGEAIPAGIVLRNGGKDVSPVVLELIQDGTHAKVFTANLDLTPNKESTFTVPADTTAKLASGRYELRVELAGFTCAAQPIRIGEPLNAAPPFRTTLHGDYTNFNSTANVWDFADFAEYILYSSKMLCINQYVNRTFAGRYNLTFLNDADGAPLLADLKKRLETVPDGVSPQKADFGFPQAHVLGTFSANGILEWLLLVNMDAALPLGTPTGYCGPITPEWAGKEISIYTAALRQFPSFQGWDWVANWWVTDYNKRFASPEEKTNYEAALKKANETGEWSPVLDTIGDRTINWQTDAQKVFGDALDKVDAKMRTSSSGPYRRPEVYPPISFSNVDEVDLHFQAEQITCPNWTPHAVDFYKRPGKPAWHHPELFNDSGTGEQILPMSFLALMRGVDGIGNSGTIPNWGALPTDSRSGYPGTASVFRALDGFGLRYGPWLTRLENGDQVAIVVSYRQIKLDSWKGVGGQYFTRLWEAYQSCLYARRPATFIFAEDKPDLRRFKALLLVGQIYEIEKPLAELLANAKKAGVAIFADSTCRESLVKDFTPLGISYDHIEKLQGFNNDAAYWEFAPAILADSPKLAAKLAPFVTPVAEIDQPEVLASERRNADARFVWLVNNTRSNLDPGLLWRVQNGVATCQPVIAHVKLTIKPGETVYDVFSGKEIQMPATDDRRLATDISFDSDLRYSQARLYAILPKKIGGVELGAPKQIKPGEKVEWNIKVMAGEKKKSLLGGIFGGSAEELKAKLPVRVTLSDGDGKIMEERFTSTGAGNFIVPSNAKIPFSITATELISGQVTSTLKPSADDRLPATDDCFGPRIRDIAISKDGSTALLNAFDWGQNLYALDLKTGKVKWTGNVGDHFAYSPVQLGDGFAVQGFDLKSAEGYHLYSIDAGGVQQRRFALPGLPARLTNWAFAAHLNDRINDFAVSPDASWIAGAGNLALAVWNRDGKLLWSQDWSKEKRQTMILLAADATTLMAANGMNLSSFEAQTGKKKWELTLAPIGKILGLAASADGKTVAASADTQSGRVFVVRDGKILSTLPAPADGLALPPDGSWIAFVKDNQLKTYSADGVPLWNFAGDSTMRFPCAAPDGKKLAVSSESGMLYVMDVPSGRVIMKRDMGAIPFFAWMSDGDLLVATWMGTAARISPDGKEKWIANIAESAAQMKAGKPEAAGKQIPTTKISSWPNAEPAPLPLTPNLINPKAVIVTPTLGEGAVELKNPVALLFDGQAAVPEKPWMSWEDIGMIDSGWKGYFSLVIDTFRTQLHVNAITFAEDPAHPESWMRDAKLEYWDSAKGQWIFSQYLTSDAVVHSHKLVKPIEAAKFRFTRPDGTGWPASNLRLAEIVFHGETMGASHPDAVANRPVAVLFDESKDDLSTLHTGFNPQFEFRNGEAASGGLCMALKDAGGAQPNFAPVFGHAVPNWDFEIVEKPEKPGQYRWLQFSYKALATETKGVSMRIGQEWAGSNAVLLDIGEPYKLEGGHLFRKKLAEKPSGEWTVVRIDLWAALEESKNWKPENKFPIRGIGLFTVGGGAAFDRILLGKDEKALEKFNTQK